MAPVSRARRIPARWLVLAAVALATSAASASFGPPWAGPGELPLARDVKSARVVRGDEPLFAAPDKTAARRGSADRGAALPVFAARAGPGCKGRWLLVGPAGWTCEDVVELSSAPPIAADARPFRPTPDGLPYRYHFVGPDGSFGYRRLAETDVGAPDMQLEPGFAVAVVQEQVRDGLAYGHTHAGLWVPMRDLAPAHASAFRGRAIDAGTRELAFAWVVADSAKVRAKPVSFGPSPASRAHFEVVPILEEAKGVGGPFYRIGDGAWIAARDVRRPAPSAPPPEIDVASSERWIDVDLATQTLVAYEGASPVFATLVSTGRGKQGSASATPRGSHRIWIKLLTSNMDNLEAEDASRYYRMEDVPYVQYFSKGVGLHGAFWHRSFGHVRSHGCVNLAPLDAERLFWWTSPHLPAGWTAVAPYALERGTLVRVR